MRKIKYFVLPFVVCIVITLLPCTYAFAKTDVFYVDEKFKPSYVDDDSLLEVPMTYSMRRSTTLDDSTVSSTAPLNCVLQSSDLVDGVIDFDNFYTWPFCSSPADRYIDHGNIPENMRSVNIKPHEDYSSNILSSYFTSSMVRLYDYYYGNEVIATDLIEWTVFWHFNVSKLNEFDDNTNYLFDFELLLNDTAYDTIYVNKNDNFFILYWDGVTSGNDGIKSMSFEPISLKRVFPSVLMARYRFTVSGKICKNIGRIGVQIYTHYQDNVGYALNGDFIIRPYTDADKVYDLGSDKPKVDNSSVNGNLNNATNAQNEVLNEYSVDSAAVGDLFSNADGLLDDTNYLSAFSQVSVWIDNFVSQNHIIYLFIITTLSISLCVYVIGRGFK